MKLEKLTVGQIIYDVKLNTSLSKMHYKWNVWPVKVLEIDLKGQRIFATWNNNEPRWIYRWEKFRYSQPK